MTQEKNVKTNLSLNVRKMKFMQHCLSEEARKELEESEKTIHSSEHWVLDLPPMNESKKKYESFNSHELCSKFYFQRLSFGGYNKSIEKLMLEYMDINNKGEDNARDSDVSISDDEMAERFSTLVGTIANKFKKPAKKTRKLNSDANETPNKIQKTKSFVTDKRGFIKPDSS